ncbi:DUF1329 domain-containing protein [Pseudoxanthomonas koreensis]|uniref:DUF1329 domain-containing protein n=1 Tax=Pseudoxanthomonas koreensis TaxID=266061 RepID=UPI0013916755|nr:DUF1329 domain-containing protein [Pseudoxanthomonas koreensis]KAF1697674.1 outer membrane lipoprotein-sorting protein [Pseudoxanthomonas koreensis]
MKYAKTFLAGALLVALGTAQAAVNPEQARQLGKNLTRIGAEAAGNADGTIPAYTGGLTKPPASFKPGSTIRPDPFAGEKPRLTITSRNMAQYEAQLTVGARALLKKYPNYRIDVYPTHRTVALPDRVLDATAANATRASTSNGGLGISGAIGGYPFPIPKDGHEAMWNHLLRYVGVASNFRYDNWNVDASGRPALATSGKLFVEYPYYDPKNTQPAAETDVYFRTKIFYNAPARRAGEALMAVDVVNPLARPRRAWLYLPGQRRVKLAPDISYDTPNPGTAGSATYDDSWIFNGAMDRFDFKLVGKKEMLVPYNTYRLTTHKKAAEVTTPHFLNPDLVRWELHRVWVVEATLKTGKRHIYARRTFYLDEDSWTALSADQYDASGQLYRASFAHMAPSYDAKTPNAETQVFYDLTSGVYNVSFLMGPYDGVTYTDPLPANQWSPDSLAGAGIR